MMHMIEFLLLVLYGTTTACGIYIIHRHRQYFYERFQKGVVSVFMLAMLFSYWLIHSICLSFYYSVWQNY